MLELSTDPFKQALLPALQPKKDDAPHVLNFGMGVESTAILLRWILEPDSRSFDLHDLVVLSAQTGDEFQSTKALVEKHIFPLLREHSIRYVQIAKHGSLLRDGYTVLSDSDSPYTLQIEGDYPMSQDLHIVGTVPRFSGSHTCAIKWKGTVIDGWQKDHLPEKYYPYLGYNAEEQRRADKCDEYTSGSNTYLFPLIEWGWSRQNCIDYIQAKLNVEWKKSSCMYCPFISKELASSRYMEEPEAGGFTLFTEFIALTLNPRMQLFPHGSAYDLIVESNNTEALKDFERRLLEQDWGLYQVERIWERKIGSSSGKLFTKVDRRISQLQQGTRELMLEALKTVAEHQNIAITTGGRVGRAYTHRRMDESASLSCEGFLVICPAVVRDKVRNHKDFQLKWERATGQVTQMQLF
jgi:hypothetical protein